MSIARKRHCGYIPWGKRGHATGRYNGGMALFFISILAGILSVFAACVLPLLPVIVGGSIASGSRRRMYVIVGSLALSVVAFTLLLKASAVLIGVPEDFWRYISGSIIVILGLNMLFPKMWGSIPFVNSLNRESNQLLSAGYRRGGFWGDVIMGAALGPVFASCSPTYFLILAAVLPASPFVGTLYLVAYAAGLSLALLLVAVLGERLVQVLGVTLDPRGAFMRSVGVLLIIVGLLVFTGTMKRIEAWFLDRGFDLTFIEHRILGAPEETSAPISDVFVSPEMKQSIYAKAPELVSPDGFINTGGKSITLAEMRENNQVVLLDIWTYSCINCQRTLPYLKAWHEKYKDDGLVIVGVHTPEFAFEKVYENVEKAARGFGLEYPIVLDNAYRTWNALGNQYWPRKYLIDIDGYIVYDHIGEGAYAETEKAIQRALAERASRMRLSSESTGEIVAESVEAPRPTGVRSPETYFGAWRNENLGNGTPQEEGRKEFVLPAGLVPNVLYLSGTWDIEHEYAKNGVSGAGIRFVYSAKDVYFVARSDEPIRIRVTRDGGKLLDEARGADVGVDGLATIHEDRLYRLVEDAVPGQHTLEIEILESGVEAYTFTFG